MAVTINANVMPVSIMLPTLIIQDNASWSVTTVMFVEHQVGILQAGRAPARLLRTPARQHVLHHGVAMTALIAKVIPRMVVRLVLHAQLLKTANGTPMHVNATLTIPLRRLILTKNLVPQLVSVKQSKCKMLVITNARALARNAQLV
jgi:hypothetical protein